MSATVDAHGPAPPGAKAVKAASKKRKLHAMLPPAPRAPVQEPDVSTRQVLDDEEYEARMAAIIERDYFPSVKNMQNKLEWTSAAESGDPERIANAQRNIALRRAGYSVPLGARATSSESIGESGRSSLYSRVRDGTGASEAHRDGAADALPAGAILPPSMQLSDFASAHTTEDQASVEAIFDKEARKKLQQHEWLYRESQRTLRQSTGAAQAAAAALPAPTDGFGTSGQAPETLLAWKHTPKSALYFPPDRSLALTDSERALMPVGAPAETVIANTRFNPDGASSAAASDDASAYTPSTIPSSPSPSAASTSEPPDEGDASNGDRVSQIGGGKGYAKVATPSPSPGAFEGEPLITWGEVGATPQRISEGYTPAASGTPGLFKGNAAHSRREKAARAAAKDIAATRPAYPPQRKSAHTPGKEGSGPSAAARKLAQSIRGKSPWSQLDKQLRSQYGHNTPSATTSVARGGLAACTPTPGLTTPSSYAPEKGLLGDMTPEWQGPG